MTGRSTEHGTFTIERSFPVAPARVFAAWSSATAKLKWFGPPRSSEDVELDFQIGGRERFVAEGPDGGRYTYEMYRDENRISVSVATIELTPADQGTMLTVTEQGVFLDGLDTVAQREHGTRVLIEQLADSVGS